MRWIVLLVAMAGCEREALPPTSSDLSPPCSVGTICAGQCVDLTADPDDCGACGHQCGSGRNATRVCIAGTCALRCSQGYTDCNGRVLDGCEVHTDLDIHNCGSCGNVCPLEIACVGGRCIGCTANATNCNGTCVDLNFDDENCTACGKACPAETSCVGGVCKCSSGFILCDGVCYIPLFNNNHCGKCGNACAMGTVCAGVKCAPCGPCMREGDTCCGFAYTPGERFKCDDVFDCAFCGRIGEACCPGDWCDGGKCEGGRCK